MTVHIVDDSEIFRKRLVELLSELKGVTIVGESESAVEAIDAIKSQKPDVVLLDVRLKSGSGIDVLQEIRTDKRTPVIIFVSSYSYPQYKDICLLLGANHFFHKATEFHRVVEVLSQLSNIVPSEM